MVGFLIISILLNIWLIYYITYTVPNNKYVEYLRQKEARDDEHRQLFFDYVNDKYRGDFMKIAQEQGKYYDMGRAKKIFDPL